MHKKDHDPIPPVFRPTIGLPRPDLNYENRMNTTKSVKPQRIFIRKSTIPTIEELLEFITLNPGLSPQSINNKLRITGPRRGHTTSRLKGMASKNLITFEDGKIFLNQNQSPEYPKSAETPQKAPTAPKQPMDVPTPGFDAVSPVSHFIRLLNTNPDAREKLNHVLIDFYKLYDCP